MRWVRDKVGHDAECKGFLISNRLKSIIQPVQITLELKIKTITI